MKQFLKAAGRNSSFMLTLAISVFVFAALLAPVAKATELEYYGVETTINEEATVSNLVNIRFAQADTTFDYGVGYKISNLNATASFGSPECSIFENVNTSRIACTLKGMTVKNNLLTLTFDTKSGVTAGAHNMYNFSSDYGVDVPVKEAFILVKIPKNSVLSEEAANQSYAPSDGKILSDGKHIMVYWQRENLTAGEDLKFSVSYSIPSAGGFYSNMFIITVAGIVIISMISVAVYVRRGSIYSKSTTEVIASVLNTDEKKVVDILARHGGKSGQKIIVRESDFSKAKVSRLVKNLKERGVVDIEPISGRENRIILKFEKKSEPNLPEAKEGLGELPPGAA